MERNHANRSNLRGGLVVLGTYREANCRNMCNGFNNNDGGNCVSAKLNRKRLYGGFESVVFSISCVFEGGTGLELQVPLGRTPNKNLNA